MLGDIAVLTAGEAISDELGIKLEKVTLDMLGTAKRVVIDKDKTTIVGGAGDKAAIDARAEAIRGEIERSDSEYDMEKLQERLAKLAGGVAVIKVGGASEAEVKERKDRIDDALHATRAAVEEGIVPGGGTALLYAAKALDGVNSPNEDQARGVDIVRRALQAPLRRIAENAGVDGAVVAGRLLAGRRRGPGLQRPDRDLRESDRGRGDRSRQGGPRRPPGRRLGRGDDRHHRGRRHRPARRRSDAPGTNFG